jgi:hypothetical protein
MLSTFRKSVKLASIAQFTLCAALLSLFILAPSPRNAAFAQSATTGAIGGVVTDSGGALLPGATITVTEVDTGATRTVKSNASGEYRVDLLHPAIYSATFTADGFETYQENSITVTVGSLSAVSPSLKVGSVTNRVEVTDTAPLMHTQDDAISTTIDQAAIDNLPINGRRWSDFTRLTPGVVSNLSGFGLLSFRGISYLLNNNTVDGADDNQAYYSEGRGRTRTAYTVSPVAVQEFQVNTSNYSAQYGRAAGGVINTVTKSGTNQFHGELFFYDRDLDLGGAANPYTLLSVANAAGDYTSVPTKPTDWRKQWGFGLGGPLIRNKLFFFYAYDQEARNFPGISRPSDPNDLFAPANATLPAGETCSTNAFTASTLTLSTEGDYNACLIAALYGTSFQAGAAYYTQGLGILQSLIGYVPRTQAQVINLPKLDYQIDDRNRVSLMYNRMRYSSPNGLYSQSSVNQGRSGWGDDNVKEDFGIARLTTVMSESKVNEAIVQYGRDFEFDPQNGPVPNELPLAHNSFGRAPGTQVGYELSGGFYAGANPDLPRYADPDERRLQLLDGFTWIHGQHVSKFGLEYNKVSDYDNNLYNGNGSYSYDWSYNFIADYLNLTTGVGGPINTTGNPGSCKGGGVCYNQTWYDDSQALGSAVGEIATREYAGYATDDWRITPNLTLTLGARYEYEYVPPPIAPNPLVPQTYEKPDDRDNIAPRVGFAWNVYGDGKTVLRGGFGLYYGRIINSNILQTYEESGAVSAAGKPLGQINYSPLYATTSCGNVAVTYPNLIASGPCSSTTPNVAFLDSNMRNPQVDETDLALEQDLGHNTTLSITYMGSFGHDLPTSIDINYNPGSTAIVPWAIAAPPAAGGVTSYPVSPNSEAPTSLAQYPVPPNTGGYTVFPHGGAKEPLTAGVPYMAKVFLNGARPNPNFYQILDVKSSVNSNYNALAFQLDRRYDNGFSLLTNVTWSHALDENPYESTVVPSYNILDPTNIQAEYGNSATDVRLRYVGALIFQPQTHFHGYKDYLLGGWRIAPLVQIQSGLPFTPSVSVSSFTSVSVTPQQFSGCAPVAPATTCIETLSGNGVNGDGSSANRLPFIDRNSYNYPKTAVVDLRVGKNFYFKSHALHFDRVRFEVFAELFNVMNHQNITGLTTEAYTLTSSAAGVPTLSPYSNFGTYTNSNSNYTYSPRQLQIAGRLHF